MGVRNANNVPMFLDALRFDLWPSAFTPPATNEFEAWTNATGDMQRRCINRHKGSVGCAFADGTVRKVGLKELYTLKWSKSFDTTGPYTHGRRARPGLACLDPPNEGLLTAAAYPVRPADVL